MNQRIIFHIDVNSAYLSWEAAHRLQHGDSLDLRTIPSVVGGDPMTRHGIVLAKSLPSKNHDIKTGETIYSAKLKCPELVIVPPNYLLYQRCSSAMKEILELYSPLIQQYSIDEYFLDYTHMDKLLGDPISTAYQIKDQIKHELGFTVNIGISINKLLAKMACEFEKPDKVHTLFPQEVPSKMWPLPIEDLFFVGRATSKKLRSRNINTIGELAVADPHRLELFLKSFGTLIWNYANGRDESLVRNVRNIVKGMGNSTTIPFDVADRETAHLVLLSLVETVATRLRQANICTKLVSISLRTNEFSSYSHQRKLHAPLDCTNQIHEITCELFNELWNSQPIRHLGVRVSELCQNDFIQLTLFDQAYDKQRAVDHTVDQIRLRFGSTALIRSSFLNSGLKALTGGVIQDEDYPMMSSIL